MPAILQVLFNNMKVPKTRSIPLNSPREQRN